MSHKASPKPYSIAVASDALIRKRDKETKRKSIGKRQRQRGWEIDNYKDREERERDNNKDRG